MLPKLSRFPSRIDWLLIIAVTFVMLQSGCAPVVSQTTPTSVPATTLTPLPTLPAAEVERATATPLATAQAERGDLSTDRRSDTTSPDGEWKTASVFQVPVAGGEYYQQLTVRHVSGSPSYTLIDGWFTLLPGYTIAEPLAWSQSGDALYYTNNYQADGCALLYNGSDLYRVELKDGTVTEVLPPDTTIKLGLAQDERHVAYQAMGEQALILHNLESGATQRVELGDLLGDDQMGAIVWSPDSSALLFAIAHNPCMGGWAESTSVVRLDTTTLAVDPLIERDNRLLVPAQWPTAEEILLENREGEQFTLNVQTGVIE